MALQNGNGSVAMLSRTFSERQIQELDCKIELFNQQDKVWFEFCI